MPRPRSYYVLGVGAKNKNDQSAKANLVGLGLCVCSVPDLDHLPTAPEQVFNSLSFPSFVFKIENYCTAGQWLKSESNQKISTFNVLRKNEDSIKCEGLLLLLLPLEAT